MTDQELFDECVTHVIRQGEQAAEYARCVYLTDGGLSCAVGGPLVARGLYSVLLEGASICSLRNGGTTAADRVLELALDAWGVCPGQYLMLQSLQRAHDITGYEGGFVAAFCFLAKGIAAELKLNTQALT